MQDQVTRRSRRDLKWGACFHYFLHVPAFSLVSSIKSFACNNVPDPSMVWHRRLGHRERSSLSLECDSCKLGKSKTLSFPLHASRASHCFDLIHSDVWGPSLISSHEQFKYYVTFSDDHSRFTWVYFLHSKYEVFRTFT